MRTRRWMALLFTGVIAVGSSLVTSSGAAVGARPASHASVLARLEAAMHVSASTRIGYDVIPWAAPRAAALGAPQLPTWSHTVDSPAGNPFTYTMVGSDPYTAGTGTTTVSVPVVGVHFIFADGQQTDASAVGSDCGMTNSPVQSALGSPLFTNSVDGTQFVDAFQRANFNDATGASGTSPDYHLLLSGSAGPVLTLDVPSTAGATVPGPCGSNVNAVEGLVDLNWFQTEITSAMSTLTGVSPQAFPVFLIYNTAMVIPGGVVALGFHSVVTSNIQTYAVADYQTVDLGSGGPTDVTALAHEAVEWANDPFGDNLAPTWGYVGQDQGVCLSSLEVADPLTDVAAQPVAVGSTTYHLPDAAFTSWFFRESPSNAAGGAYSFFGSFTQPSDASVCPAQPVSVTATAGDGKLTVSWTEPSGTAPIDSYVVLLFPHQDNVDVTTLLTNPGTTNLQAVTSATASSGMTSTSISGLTNGTAYDAVVVARSVNGLSIGSCVPLFVALAQTSSADDCSTPSFTATATPASSDTTSGSSGGTGQSGGGSPTPNPSPNPSATTLASTSAAPAAPATGSPSSSGSAPLAFTGANDTLLLVSMGALFFVIGALGRRRLTARR